MAPPDFPDPEALDLSEKDKKNIVETISELYRQTVEGRDSYATKHQDYDLAFRGQLNLRGPNSGPWPGSSNLHIQMPYWLVDAYNTRLVSAIWGQNPQVVGHPTEDDDEEVARDSANLIQWHLQPKRMNARANWSRISKTRCIHGRGVGIMPWATEEYLYRVTDEVRYEFDEEGDIVTDDEGVPIESADSQSPVLKEKLRWTALSWFLSTGTIFLSRWKELIFNPLVLQILLAQIGLVFGSGNPLTNLAKT